MGREFNLSRDQRLAILERDNNECVACGIFEACNRREPERVLERLNVHHILPRGYSVALGINPNFPENLITVCKTFHTGHPTLSIHPDTYQAQMTYQGQKDSFKKMSIDRKEKLDNRQIYWNNQYDRQLTVLAVRNTQRADDRIKDLLDKQFTHEPRTNSIPSDEWYNFQRKFNIATR